MIYFITNSPSLIKPEQYEYGTIEGLFEWLENTSEIEVDTETEGFDAFTKRIICAQFGNYDIQWVIERDIIFNSDVKIRLKTIMEDKNKLFLFQNALFDLRFFYLQGIYPQKIYDTYIAETCIMLGYDRGTYSRSLLSMAYNYLGIHLDKEIRGHIHFKGLSPDVIEYAANDVKYLGKIKEKQLEIINKKGLNTVVNLENEFVKTLTYLTLSGIKLDKERWLIKCEKDEAELKRLENQLTDYILEHSDEFPKYVNKQLSLFDEGFTCNINFNSSHQVVKLFKDLGLDLSTKDKKTGKIKDSVEANVLIPQKDKHPLIPIYLEYKSQEKTVSTYGRNWLKHINPVTGRLHTQYTQMLDTGRLSSGGKTETGEEFINFLNIPQDNEIRNCIIPEKDYVFIDVDYTGQETLVFAEFSGEPSMIEFLNSDGSDMHSFIASKIYPELANVSLDEIKSKHKKARQSAKAAGFAIQYGGVGATIAKNLSIPIEEGEFVYNSYMEAFPKAKEYFDTCKKKVLKNGYINTNDIINRKIHFSSFEKYKELEKEIDSDFWREYRDAKKANDWRFPILKEKVREFFMVKGRLERASLNFPIQSSSADMSKIAAIYVFNHIYETGNMFKVLFPLMIHDQIILECPESESEYWAKVVSDSMVKSGNIFCKKVQIKAEPEILKFWKK